MLRDAKLQGLQNCL